MASKKSDSADLYIRFVHTTRGRAAVTLGEAARLFGVSSRELEDVLVSRFYCTSNRATLNMSTGRMPDNELFLDSTVIKAVGDIYCVSRDRKKWLDGVLSLFKEETQRLTAALDGERARRGEEPIAKESRGVGKPLIYLPLEDDPCVPLAVQVKSLSVAGVAPAAKAEPASADRIEVQAETGLKAASKVEPMVKREGGMETSVSVEGSDALQVFESEQFGSVRVVLRDGEPWFVAKDVCACLAIANHRDAVSLLEEDERDGVGITDSIGRAQTVTAVSEAGLYSLVLRSRKPEAKAFKRWITHEVLPSIRKTGGYSLDGLPKDLPSALRLAADLEEARLRLEQENKALRPKAEYCDTVLNNTDLLIRHTQLSADLGYSNPSKMLQDLDGIKVVKRINGQWVLRAKYCGQGYAHSVKTLADEEDGGQAVEVILGWTPRGERLVRESLVKAGKVSSLADVHPDSDAGTGVLQEGGECQASPAFTGEPLDDASDEG